ncbi:hypothetical protein EDB83DRAFT_2523300 [Lactarius deliciosus]|nr:hypothetical protein EDB83DRAFT_2523300 [Lactarius deliciosus]
MAVMPFNPVDMAVHHHLDSATPPPQSATNDPSSTPLCWHYINSATTSPSRYHTALGPAQIRRDPKDNKYDPQRKNEVHAAMAVLEHLLGAWEYETDHVQTARAVSSYTPHPSMHYQEPWE